MNNKKEDRRVIVALLAIVIIFITYFSSIEPVFRGNQVVCGNNVVEPGEQCDPPWTSACPSVPSGQVPLACTLTCQCQPQNSPGGLPYISSITPDIVSFAVQPTTISIGQLTIPVRLTGANFINPITGMAVVLLADNVPLLPTTYTVLNDNAIDVRISQVMTPRSYRIELATLHPLTGQPLKSNAKQFTIMAKPTITSVSPQVIVSNSQPNTLVIRGTNFVPPNPSQSSLTPSLLYVNGNNRYNQRIVSDSVQILMPVPPYPPVGPYTLSVQNTINGVNFLAELKSSSVTVYVAAPGCGNSVAESNEQCDPPGSSCRLGSSSGICNSACQCQTTGGQQPTSPRSYSSGSSSTTLDFEHRASYDRTLRVNNIVFMRYNGRSYSIRVQAVRSQEVEFKILPRYPSLVIAEGESENINLDSDNVADINIEVEDITRGMADVKFTRLESQPRPQPPPTVEPPSRQQEPPVYEPEPQYPEPEPYIEPEAPVEPKEDKLGYVLIAISGVIIVVIVVAIVILLVKRKKGDSNSNIR